MRNTNQYETLSPTAVERGRVLIVEDDPDGRDAMQSLLTVSGYDVHACANGSEAIDKLMKNRYEVVLSDIRMPGMSGVELLDVIHLQYPNLPVVLITAYSDFSAVVDALKKNAFDLILKPYRARNLLESMNKAVRFHRLMERDKHYKEELERKVIASSKELKNASREMIQNLANVAEYRDTDTGEHIKRIGLYARSLSRALGMKDDFVETLAFASTLHDIGKVGIPDNVLLKRGPLSHSEFEVIRTHTTIGAKMLARSRFPGMDMAASIALSHHERWDGTGYPAGLRGESIPLEGRIVMLIDQYDAMRSVRPYKNAYDHGTVVSILAQGNERTKREHFDPAILETFMRVADEFDTIFNTHQGNNSIFFLSPDKETESE